MVHDLVMHGTAVKATHFCVPACVQEDFGAALLWSCLLFTVILHIALDLQPTAPFSARRTKAARCMLGSVPTTKRSSPREVVMKNVVGHDLESDAARGKREQPRVISEDYLISRAFPG
jgi:hypothetical protein